VFAVGSTIRTLDVRSRAQRIVARTRGKPIGLSASGNSVMWAENAGKRGFIRMLSLP
jgi:hypothetical protein